MNLRRSNKIIAVIGTDKKKRAELFCDVIVAAGMARIRSDAVKIASKSVSDIDLDGAFIVLVSNFSFSESDYITGKLIRMALMGIPVIVGVSRIPNALLQFCEVIDR